MSSEPEVIELDDEVAEIPLTTSAVGADVPSPMADLPTGAKFGTLVHAVLEKADPFAADLAAELEAQVREHAVWWPVDVPADELAAAMVPMHDTPLGPLADGMTLRQIGLRDRMREMDFEFPLAGGDLRAAAPEIRLSHVGELLRAHLPKDDPLASYADRLTGAALGGQPLKGYLSGSVDVVLRIGDRYVVVDYKTNWLGDPAEPLTAADYAQPRLAEAMLHSDYPLQALLYSVVLHRFLRWRLPGYAPEKHLGGVMYLFLRGMCGPDTPWSTAIRQACSAGSPGGAHHSDVGSARRGPGGRMTTVEWRQARGATGLLRTFSDAAVLESSDVHVAQRLTALAKEPDETVALAVAMAVRALRNGSVCVDLRSVEQQVGVDGLPWPDVDEWLAAMRASRLAGTPPTLRLDGDLLYLDRYWLEEQQVPTMSAR